MKRRAPAKDTDWKLVLQAFRKRHGLTQEQLAALLPTGTTAGERTIQDWEAGERTPPLFLKRALRDLARELSSNSENPLPVD